MAANNRPFMCLQCPKGANSRANMMSHIANMHRQVKPFACSEHGCAETCARADHLKKHVGKTHGRGLRNGEGTANQAMLDSIKAEADLTVWPRPAPAAAAAPAAPPAPPPPAPAPPVAAPPAPPAPPAAPPANIDRLTIPGYFSHFGIPYGTGPPIPGGR